MPQYDNNILLAEEIEPAESQPDFELLDELAAEFIKAAQVGRTQLDAAILRRKLYIDAVRVGIFLYANLTADRALLGLAYDYLSRLAESELRHLFRTQFRTVKGDGVHHTRRLVISPAIAVLDETLVQLVKRYRTAPEISLFFTRRPPVKFSQMLRRDAIDLLRRETVQRLRGVGVDPNTNRRTLISWEDVPDAPSHGASDEFRAMWAKRLIEQLRALFLAERPEAEWQIVWEHGARERVFRDIAAQFGVSPATVCRIWREAKNRLEQLARKKPETNGAVAAIDVWPEKTERYNAQ